MKLDSKEIQDKIDLVTNELLKRKPGVNFTTFITLWNDGTSLVRAKHGDCDKIYMVVYYQNELSYQEFDSKMVGDKMMYDVDGNEYYRINQEPMSKVVGFEKEVIFKDEES